MVRAASSPVQRERWRETDENGGQRGRPTSLHFFLQHTLAINYFKLLCCILLSHPLWLGSLVVSSFYSTVMYSEQPGAGDTAAKKSQQHLPCEAPRADAGGAGGPQRPDLAEFCRPPFPGSCHAWVSAPGCWIWFQNQPSYTAYFKVFIFNS